MPCCRTASSPTDQGRCAAIFGDWQTLADGGDQLLDPSRSQHKEFFIVVNAVRCSTARESPPARTPAWAAISRSCAADPRLPEEARRVEMTPHLGFDSKADPGLSAGARYGGTGDANGCRVADASVTLEELATEGPTHNAPPLVNVRHFPRRLEGQRDEQVARLVTFA